jgi:hypothetical protein
MTGADFAKKVGISEALLSQIRYRPPTRLPKHLRVDVWADRLQLTEQESAALLWAAELAWSPAGIQKFHKELEGTKIQGKKRR